MAGNATDTGNTIEPTQLKDRLETAARTAGPASSGNDPYRQAVSYHAQCAKLVSRLGLTHVATPTVHSDGVATFTLKEDKKTVVQILTKHFGNPDAKKAWRPAGMQGAGLMVTGEKSAKFSSVLLMTLNANWDKVKLKGTGATSKVSIADALKYVQSLGVKVDPKPDSESSNGALMFYLKMGLNDAVAAVTKVLGKPEYKSRPRPRMIWRLDPGGSRLVVIAAMSRNYTPWLPHIALIDRGMKDPYLKNNVTANYIESAKLKEAITAAGPRPAPRRNGPLGTPTPNQESVREYVQSLGLTPTGEVTSGSALGRALNGGIFGKWVSVDVKEKLDLQNAADLVSKVLGKPKLVRPLRVSWSVGKGRTVQLTFSGGLSVSLIQM